jgi:hypothetical protein
MSVDSEQPAVISNPTDASRAALQSAVNEAMHTEVLLAEDALTDSSLLIIERRKTQSIDGMPADGRTMDMPIQFRLVTNGVDCILVDQRNQARYVLADTSCRAEVSGD